MYKVGDFVEVNQQLNWDNLSPAGQGMSWNMAYEVSHVYANSMLGLDGYLLVVSSNEVVASTEDRSWKAKNEGRYFPDTRNPNKKLDVSNIKVCDENGFLTNSLDSVE